jgi:hypothetical protein
LSVFCFIALIYSGTDTPAFNRAAHQAKKPLNTEAVALSEELQQPEAWLLRLLNRQMLSQRSKSKR